MHPILYLFGPTVNIAVPLSLCPSWWMSFVCIPPRLLLKMGIYIWGHCGGSGGAGLGGGGSKYNSWSESGPLGLHGLTGKQVSSRDWMWSSCTWRWRHVFLENNEEDGSFSHVLTVVPDVQKISGVVCKLVEGSFFFSNIKLKETKVSLWNIQCDEWSLLSTEKEATVGDICLLH